MLTLSSQRWSRNCKSKVFWFLIYQCVSRQTDSVLNMFFLAMVLHPEVQIKVRPTHEYAPPLSLKPSYCQAQEEIDRVVGDTRLPDFSDREKLPYIEAVYLETLRWEPTVPVGESRLNQLSFQSSCGTISSSACYQYQ